MRGRNLPRDNRTKEVSYDTSLEDFNSSRLFLFRQDTTPPLLPQDTFLPCLKKSRGLGQSPSAPPEKFVFRSIRRVVNFGGPGVPMAVIPLVVVVRKILAEIPATIQHILVFL
jgi:hypothetical protein